MLELEEVGEKESDSLLSLSGTTLDQGHGRGWIVIYILAFSLLLNICIIGLSTSYWIYNGIAQTGSYELGFTSDLGKETGSTLILQLVKLSDTSRIYQVKYKVDSIRFYWRCPIERQRAI
jgi:hypothetical protein